MTKILKLRFLAVLFMTVLFMLFATCVPPEGTGKSTIALSTFQNAEIVIGQQDFAGCEKNQGGGNTADGSTLSWVYGNPLLSATGTLYLPDYGNNRVLVFNSLPVVNGASADFVLGQPDFTTVSSGTTASKMQGAQTIMIYDDRLYITDCNNSRVLIWNTIPSVSGAPADVVVGQTDMISNSTSCTASTLRYSESIFIVDGKLLVSDSLNHRVLIWETLPDANGAPASRVLGQADFIHSARNDDNQDGIADATPSDRTMNYPAGIWSDGTRLYVVDSGNNRVLLWKTFPTADFQPADAVLGQIDMTSNTEAAGQAGMDSPFFIDSNGIQLAVSDSDNNRVLVWNTLPAGNSSLPDTVLGQSDFIHNISNDDNQDGTNDAVASARVLNFPTGLLFTADSLIVGDCNNCRYIVFKGN
ncbi:MAG: hypothetical protein JW904_00115 [Spirochaetales bacterium]|nr:hypothetical protein [Spirochaetales bacterium]